MGCGRYPVSDMTSFKLAMKNVHFVPHTATESMNDRIRRIRSEIGASSDGPPATSPVTGSHPPHQWANSPSWRPRECGWPTFKQRKASHSRGHPKAWGLSTKWVVRRDAPVIRHSRRGSAEKAASALQCKGLASLEADLIQDKVAKSSIQPTTTAWKTWKRMHRRALQNRNYLPLTPSGFVAIGALFKAGDYRSFPNYASVAKARHLEYGYRWSQLLNHTRSWVTRSVLRGIGPARQSCPLQHHRVLELPHDEEALSPGGPLHPVRTAILATLFLLREIECSTAVLSSWSFDKTRLEFTWLLPSSKTDHLALGVSRTWPCMCGLPGLGCPYHLARAHRRWLRSSSLYFGPDTPVFPRADGWHPQKQAMVATIEAIAQLTGAPLLDVHGARRFGGHSLRVTGAQLFAALGLAVEKIRILARHSGDTIFRYVSEAPLRTLRSDLGLPPLTGQLRVDRNPQCETRELRQHRRHIRALEKRIDELQEQLHTTASDVVAVGTAFARTDERIFVQNSVAATVHAARIADHGATMCGWRWSAMTSRNGGNGRVLRSLKCLPASMLCDRCLKTERAIAQAVQDAELSGDETAVV